VTPTSIEKPVVDRRPPLARWDRTRLAVVLFGVVGGIALRAFVLLTPLGAPDSDEAVVGLMARHLAHGEHTTFFWGQNFGGTPFLYLMTPVIRVFGTSFFTLRLTGTLLAAVNAVLVWRVGRRLFSEQGAIAAGLVSWVWPAMAVWFSVREQLFYVPTVTAGLLAWLIALGRSRPRGWPDAGRWLACGFVLGLGWWMSPNIIYFAVPLAVWMLWDGERRARWPMALAAVPGAVVGAAPWLRFNLSHDWASMRLPVFDSPSPPAANARFLAEGAYPGLIGLRQPFYGAWHGAWAQFAGWPLALVAVAVLTGVALRARGLDGIALVCFPILYLAQPFGTVYSNLRYVFWLAPMLALAIGRVAPTPRRTVAIVVAALVASSASLIGFHTNVTREPTPLLVANTEDTGPAVDLLLEQDLTHGYAGYWTAFVVTYQSGERIIVAPTSFNDRYPRYRAQVDAADHPFWMVITGSDQERALRADLDHLGVGATWHTAGEWTILVPDRAVRPDEVSAEARY